MFRFQLGTDAKVLIRCIFEADALVRQSAKEIGSWIAAAGIDNLRQALLRLLVVAGKIIMDRFAIHLQHDILSLNGGIGQQEGKSQAKYQRSNHGFGLHDCGRPVAARRF
jgi:hypothetical protein